MRIIFENKRIINFGMICIEHFLQQSEIRLLGFTASAFLMLDLFYFVYRYGERLNDAVN